MPTLRCSSFSRHFNTTKRISIARSVRHKLRHRQAGSSSRLEAAANCLIVRNSILQRRPSIESHRILRRRRAGSWRSMASLCCTVEALTFWSRFGSNRAVRSRVDIQVSYLCLIGFRFIFLSCSCAGISNDARPNGQGCSRCP